MSWFATMTQQAYLYRLRAGEEAITSRKGGAGGSISRLIVVVVVVVFLVVFAVVTDVEAKQSNRHSRHNTLIV